MRSMNSIFSGRYYIYSLKRILPYALAMTAIMIVLNVMTYVVNNPFGYETCIYTVNISFVTIPLMYLYPVLLSVGLFNFLHKKNKSDFFGSSPIKRTSLFITNIIVGFTVIAGMLLINTFVLLAIVKTNYALNIASPMIFFEHFIVWLAGYMVVFAIASLAASISGTVIAQLLATCIFLFLPAFLAYMVQAPLFEGMNNPNLSNYTAVTSDLFYLNTVSMDSIFMFRSYHTLLFAFLFNFNGFYGFGNIAGLLNILYNFILAAGVIILGAVMLKKRSFETAEMPFKNNIILDVMLGLAFFPLFFIGVITIEATFSVCLLYTSYRLKL